MNVCNGEMHAPQLNGVNAQRHLDLLHTFYIKTNATVDTAVAPKTAYPVVYAPLIDKTSKTR
jgi:hypothetical protein